MSDTYLKYNEKILKFDEKILLKKTESPTHEGTFLQKWVSNSGYERPIIGYSIFVDKSNNDGVFCGGAFSGKYDDVSIGGIIKFKNNGVLDSSFYTNWPFSDTYAFKMCMDYSVNKLVVGGNLTNRVIYKIDPITGANYSSFNQSAYRTKPLNDVVMDSNGNVYACGGSDEHWILTPTGTSIPPWSSAIFNGAQRTHSALPGAEPSTLYIGGDWTSFRGESWPYFLKSTYDASIIKSYAAQSLINGVVNHMIFDPSNNMILCGQFTTVGGQTKNRIVKLLDGSTGIDTSFDISVGFNGTVRRMALDVSLNRLYCVGDFTSYANNTRNRIVALNLQTGAIDNSFDVSNGFNLTLYDIAIGSDNKVYIAGGSAGEILKYGNKVLGPFVRLNSDGSNDTYTPNDLI